MTRQLTLYLLMTMFATVMLVATTSPLQAQTNKHYEACQTLDGEYEERRTNCDPECETTYICRFGDGWSRVCDEQGVCNQVQEGTDGTTSEAAESEGSFEDCVADAADYCLDKCDDEYGVNRVDCTRSCLEDQEGQCEEYDAESDYSDVLDGECEECKNLCEDACDAFRQSWRRDNCRSECKSRCDNVCG